MLPSSCRLSRTMIQIGQAAGTVVALAKEYSVNPIDVPYEKLKDSLLKQNIQLTDYIAQWESNFRYYRETLRDELIKKNQVNFILLNKDS